MVNKFPTLWTVGTYLQMLVNILGCSARVGLTVTNTNIFLAVRVCNIGRQLHFLCAIAFLTSCCTLALFPPTTLLHTYKRTPTHTHTHTHTHIHTHAHAPAITTMSTYTTTATTTKPPPPPPPIIIIIITITTTTTTIIIIINTFGLFRLTCVHEMPNLNSVLYKSSLDGS